LFQVTDRPAGRRLRFLRAQAIALATEGAQTQPQLEAASGTRSIFASNSRKLRSKSTLIQSRCVPISTCCLQVVATSTNPEAEAM